MNTEKLKQLITTQQELGNKITTLLNNSKKDSPTRRTEDYIRKRSAKLETYWNIIQENHDDICELNPDKDQPYFKTKYFEQLQQLVEETKNYLKTCTKAPPVTNADQEQVTRIRRQECKIDLLKQEFEKVKKDVQQEITLDELDYLLQQISDEWKSIKNLHEEIVSKEQDFDVEYFTDNTYNKSKTRYDETVRIIQNRKKQLKPSNATVPLPTIKIPYFDGKYEEWSTFHELFQKIIHNNATLSNIEKMQYLKTHIVGEPRKMIQHLQANDANYATAWDLLKKRFHNNRLVLNKLLDKILDLPTCQEESAMKLQQLHDTTTECLQAIDNLGIDTSSWGPIICRILSRKWDAETNRIYEQSLEEPHKIQDFKTFVNFLETRFQSLETIKYNRTNNVNTASQKTVKQCGEECRYCNQFHPIYYCQKFKSLSPSDRLQAINNKKLCKNCLNHSRDDKCQSARTCRVCNRQHHTLLHIDSATKSATPSRSENKKQQEQKPKPTSVSSNIGTHDQSVLLTTALIHVKTYFGSREILRVLIDPGSQASLITEHAAQLLGHPKQKIHAEISGLGDGQPKISNWKINCQISPRFSSQFQINVDLLVLSKLTQVLPQKSFEADLTEWQNHMLADPTFNKAGPIDAILGAKEFGNILLQGLQKSSSGLVAQNTELGWILSGCLNNKTTNKIQVNTMITRLNEDQQLTKFWEIEDSDQQRSQTQEDSICEEYYEKTTTRNNDGTYTVRIPFKEQHDNMGNSKSRAVSRLLHLEKRFTKEPKLHNDYKQFMAEYIELGHMQQVPKERVNEAVYYIPHQPVIRESSTTTKLRVVFDASSKTSQGISLNDTMHTGPKLQQELVDILLRWRKYHIVFSADIEKMYRQIKLHSDDRKYHRLLWRPDQDKSIQEYELTTVTYGTTAAPYLAIRTLQQLAKDEQHAYPKAAKVSIRDFYVDDVLSGADTIPEAVSLQQELIAMMRKGGFTLRKWSSNNEALLNNLPENMKDLSSLELKQDETRKSLGVLWAPFDDTFRFKVEVSQQQKSTKRHILSEVAKIFDPLGWLSPVVVKAKMLIQELWVQNLQWDQPVPTDIEKYWSSFQGQLKEVEKITIPRWINYCSEKTKLELHGFSDASEKAYGAVIYAKVTELSTGNVTITLLTAKSKVAPTKGKTTLPRLELCAAVLLAKIMKRTLTALDVSNVSIRAWSDSMISLGWIKGNPCRWKTFVANRVAEIIKIIPANQWYYVSTKENPADLISRGTDPAKLKNSTLWWSGPNWLKDKTQWPKEEKFVEPKEEIKKYVGVITNTKKEDITQRFSSLSRMLRVLSYCRRFIKNSRGQEKQRGRLTTQELDETLHAIILSTQQIYLENERATLEGKKQLNKNSKLSTLTPFLDGKGILRIGGRLQNSQLSYDEKHPIILLYEAHLTKLAIDNAHKTMLHGGCQSTLGYLRHKFWVINGKKAVSSFIRKCTRCIRFKAQCAEQQMGELPAARVTPSHPFSHTGIDYAGPIAIRASKGRGHTSYKGYIAVFVCFSTKAVHLEVVSDMTTDSFLAAFRRFIARRGNCNHIYSDNGTTFVGASKQLLKEVKTIEKDSFVQDVSTTLGTQWHFIPPTAPHFGGLWEAGVKSMKHHLKRVIGDSTLTYEELTTLMHQIEACLNSRPLTVLSDVINDVQVLTPGHFLIGRELVTPPNPIETPVTSNLSSRWRLVQKMKKDFWQAWSAEYLSRLQQRYKWKTKSNNLQVGEMVLIREGINPSRWPLAQIIEVHPGKDDTVRVVSLRKAEGIVTKKAITSIIPLPTSTTSEITSAPTSQSGSINVAATSVLIKEEKTFSRQHSRKSSIKLAMLWLFLLLFTSTTAVQSESTTYNIHYPPPGMYVEHIGQARLERGKFRVELQMERAKLDQDVEAAESVIKEVNQLCTNMKTLTDDTPCDSFVHHLQELEKQIQWIKEGITSYSRRQKRGLLGQLLTSVFGVNDEVYKDIETLDKNQQELIRASSHQTKFMLSTLTTLNETEARVTKKLENFQKKLNKGIAVINEMSRWYATTDANKLSIHFLATYELANNFLNDIIHYYSRLLTIQHDPDEFYELISQYHISQVLASAAKKLPSNIEVLSSPLLEIEVQLSSEVIRIYGYFPITEKPNFVLLKVTPVPLQIKNHSYWVLDLSTEILAVEYNTQLYFQLSHDELENSEIISQDYYLCSPSTVRSIENNQHCIIDEIYQRTETNTCPIREVKINTIVWKELYKINSWLFIAEKRTKVALICNGVRTDIPLQGSGIIQISQDCIIKTKQNILAPKKTNGIRLVEGFTKHVPPRINATWRKQVHHDSLEPEEEPIIGLSETFGKIKKKEEELQEALGEETWKKIRNHTTNYSLGIGGAILTLILLVWGVPKVLNVLRSHRSNRKKPDATPPQPEMVELQPIFPSVESEASTSSFRRREYVQS